MAYTMNMEKIFNKKIKTSALKRVINSFSTTIKGIVNT